MKCQVIFTAEQSRKFLLKDSAQLKGGRSTLRALSTAGNTNTATREIPQIGSVFGRYGGTWDTDISNANAASALAKPGIKNENDLRSHVRQIIGGGRSVHSRRTQHLITLRIQGDMRRPRTGKAA